MKRQAFILILTLALFTGRAAAQPCAVNIAAVPPGAICEGTSVTFTATPGPGVLLPTYQWRKGGSNILDETNPTYTTTSLANGDVITVVMTATGCTGSPVTSNSITMTVAQTPVSPTLSSASPVSTSIICANYNAGTATFTGGSGGGSNEYQFSIDGGTNWFTYTNSSAITTTGGTTSVQVRGRRSGGACTASAYNTYTIWTYGSTPVAPTLSSASPANGSTICASFNTGTVTGTGGSGGSTGAANEYQVSINGGSSYIAYISGDAIITTGATGSVIVQARRTGGNYGCPTSAWSTICTWTIGSTPVAPTLGAASPADGSTVCAGFNSGTVTGIGGSGGSTGAANEYQFSINGGGTYSVYTNGAVIITTGGTGSVIVQARRTGGIGGCPTSAWSTICTWTIGSTPVAPTLGSANPADGSTICAGFNTGTVTGTGGSGGSSGAANEYQFSINGGGTYSVYTNGAVIITTGGTGSVIVQARRTGGIGGCPTSAWSTICTWTIGSTPVAPTLGAASPADGSTVCAGFNSGTVTGIGGSGGSTGAANEYQVSINGGSIYSSYTNGAAINTTGATGSVIIRSHRTGGSYGCTFSSWNIICTWTIGSTPVAPTLGTASPASGSTICAGFNTGTVTGTGGSGGSSGAGNEYQVSINGGSTYIAYLSGDAINTTGATGSVIVQSRRTGGNYGCLASAWGTISTWNAGSLSTDPTGIAIVNNNTCNGISKTLTVTGGSLGTGASWQWYTGSCGGISAGTGLSIVVDPVNGTSTTYYVRAVGTCNTTSCTNGIVVVPAIVGSPVFTLGAASIHCQGIGTVTYTATAANSTGITYSLDAASIIGGNSIVPATGEVTYAATWIGTTIITASAAGCSGPTTATHTVTITPTVGIPTTPTPSITTICQGSANTSYTSSATNATTYNWNVTGAGNIITGTGPAGTVTWAPGYSGIATVSVTANGCNGPSVAASTTVTVRPSPIASISGSTTVCQNTSPPNVTFTNPQDLAIVVTYNINGINPTQIAVSANGSATVAALTSSTGTFVYNLVSADYQTAPTCTNNISGSATIRVNASPIPTMTRTDPDSFICQGTSVTFTAGGGTNYNFRLQGTTVQNGTSNTYTTSSLANGQVISVIVTNSNGCIAAPIGITNFVNPPPFIFVSSPATCSTDLTTYSLSVAVSTGTVTSSSGTVTSIGGNVWTISGVHSGTNVTVRVTDANSCENTLVVTAPNCSCPVILAPVSGGDRSYCVTDIIPAISVTVSTGQTADWYSTSSGGSPLLSGSLSYTPSAAGTYYAIARNTTTGCLSSTRTAVTVIMNALPIPTLTSSDPDNSFCAGTTVTFTATGGTNFNFRVGGIIRQSGISPTYTTNTLTNGQIVEVIVTNANGCSAISAGITNTVNTIPAPNAGTGGNECDLNFNFHAIPGIGAGTWTKTTGPGTVIFTPNANSATATVTVSQYGTYTFTWTETNAGCSSSATITVIFNQQPVANPGTGGNSCGKGTLLNAIPSVGAGTWTKTAGSGTAIFTPNANTPNASVTVPEFGVYTFTWTEVNGTCSNSAGVNVSFLQVPAANAGADGSECDLDFILKAVQGTGTGTWTKFSGPGDAIFSPNANQAGATVTVNQYGTYDFSWTEQSSVCQSFDIVRVVFNPLPAVSAGRDTTICKGGSVQLGAQGVGSFHWDPDSLTNNPNIGNPIVTPLKSTLFKVTLTDLNGCKNSDDLMVGVMEKAIANAGVDQTLDYQLETTMDAVLTNEYETGTWSVISGTGVISDISDAKTSVTELSLDVNKLLWTVTNHICPVSSDTVTITVGDFVIPTLITPNLDGNNDYFVLRGLSTLGKTELVIFDRRGVRVYQNSDYDNSWDGVDYNNKPLPDDTYFYVLKTKNGKSMSGYIVIRR